MSETKKPEYYLSYKGERTYSILGYIDEVDEYIDNKGYIDKSTGKIYICSKDKEPVYTDVPILKITKTDNGIEKELIDVSNPDIAKLFKEESLYRLDLGHISENTTGDEVLYDEEMLLDMNVSTNIFVPIINDTDDSLKKIIKQTIISKDIDINRIRHRMPQKYGLTNLKSALNGKTKMSVQSFNIWCELLGIEYEIVVKDTGADTINPLPKPLYYSSKVGRVEELE